MRAVVQRVSQARVTVAGEIVGEISRGLLIFLGVEAEDSSADAKYLAEKIVGLRIFNDSDDKMNLGLLEAGGELLVVSQFTLLGDCRKGRRPSFITAARPEIAVELYEQFTADVQRLGASVASGRFQQHMEVTLVNDGPITLILDSRKQF